MLSSSFLSPYRQRVDAFDNLLARSTYKNKYCRDGESWTDTVRRVVEGNIASDKTVTREETEKLFHVLWTMQGMPPGRGLWTGGVPGIPAAAIMNCHYVTIRDFEDWCWTMDQLMLGGGVGVGLASLSSLRVVSHISNPQLKISCKPGHPDVKEVNPDPSLHLGAMLPDTREGWIEGLRLVFRHAVEGKDLFLDLSDIRPRGTPLRTFGGVACGPGPLAYLLRGVWNILRGAAGRKLTDVEGLDITTHLGRCVSAGGVRRSALLCMSDYSTEFLSVKADVEKLSSHRYSSNNTISVERLSHFDRIDFRDLVRNAITYGDPGLFNKELAQRTDPGAVGCNPCAEQILHDYESCCLSEVFPAKRESHVSEEQLFRLMTRFTLRQRIPRLHSEKSQELAEKNMRIGVGLGGLCDFDWTAQDFRRWYSYVRHEANRYADELGVTRPIAVTTVKPSGTISLLAGSSPGIHAPFAPYYLRRVRIDKDDPIAAALLEAKVPSEVCHYDPRTLLFGFPTKAKHTRAFAQRETIQEQFQRNLLAQEHWSDNSVSATISFDADQVDEMALALSHYAPRLKTVSFMARTHGFKQPPYEEIDEETFERLSAPINNNHPLTQGYDIDVAECAGGACPIR